MKHPIRSPEELGLVIRAVRKSAKVRQDDLAGVANVSRQFTIEAERGKPTMQFGKLLSLLDELGVMLSVEIPDEVEPVLRRLEQDRARTPRATRTTGDVLDDGEASRRHR